MVTQLPPATGQGLASCPSSPPQGTTCEQIVLNTVVDILALDSSEQRDKRKPSWSKSYLCPGLFTERVGSPSFGVDSPTLGKGW